MGLTHRMVLTHRLGLSYRVVLTHRLGLSYRVGLTQRAATPNRRASTPGRRAAAAPQAGVTTRGGLAVLVRHPGGTAATPPAPQAQHRVPRVGSRRRRPVPPQRRAPREPQRTMQLLMTGLGAVILTGICGLIAFFIVADERHGGPARTRSSAVAAAVTFRDISSRAVDAAPLSVAEVFPQSEIRMIAGAAPYRVHMTHIDTDCHLATTGEMGRLLAASGCSQVVRATMTAPGSGYRVTAGIFNLTDESRAQKVVDGVKPLVDTGAGSFAAVAAQPGTEPSDPASAQVGWHARGHFLVYCVITRPDGQVIPDGDLSAERIVHDLIESYLREGVVGRRASGPPVLPSTAAVPEEQLPAQPLAPTGPLAPTASLVPTAPPAAMRPI